jgi:hypothetical protein
MKLSLLFESAKKIQFIADNMGEKLISAAEEDHSAKQKDDALKIVGALSKIDPTGDKHDFLQYIARMYAQRQFRMEDANRLKRDLKDFIKFRAKIQNKDLNSYKKLDDLYAAIETIRGPVAKSKGAVERKIKSDGSKLLIDDPDFKVYQILKKAAACFYGAGTKWCTASEQHSMFNRYAKQGNLFIIIVKGPPLRKFQFHFEAGQVMNEKDQPLDKDDIALLSKHEGWAKFLNMMIRQHYTDK